MNIPDLPAVSSRRASSLVYIIISVQKTLPYLNDVCCQHQHHSDRTKLLWLVKLKKQTAYIHYIVKANVTLFLTIKS